MTDKLLQETLDEIKNSIRDVSVTVNDIKSNGAAQLKILSNRMDRTEEELKEGKQSRTRLHQRIDAIMKHTEERFHEHEKRMDDIEGAPAREALRGIQAGKATFRDALVSKSANLIVGFVMVLALIVLGIMLDNRLSAILPSAARAAVEEVSK